MDRLGNISVFLSVAEHGSFARAGNIIGVSGSAVSKNVARLEDRLRVRLFHRTTRALSLTDDGREFRDRCVHILADLAEAESQMSERAAAPSGVLRISLPATLGRVKIVPALGLFTSQFPGLRVEASLNDGAVNMVDSGVDVIVKIGEPRDSSLIMKRVGAVRYIVCAAPSYLARHGLPKTPDELAPHDCVKRLPYPCSPRGAWKFADPVTGAPFERPVSGMLSFDSAEAVANAALAGSGLAQLHDYLAEPYINSGELTQVMPEYSAEGPPICILYPSARHVAPKVRAFIDIVAELLSDRQRTLAALAA